MVTSFDIGGTIAFAIFIPLYFISCFRNFAIFQFINSVGKFYNIRRNELLNSFIHGIIDSKKYQRLVFIRISLYTIARFVLAIVFIFIMLMLIVDRRNGSGPSDEFYSYSGIVGSLGTVILTLMYVGMCFKEMGRIKVRLPEVKYEIPSIYKPRNLKEYEQIFSD